MLKTTNSNNPTWLKSHYQSVPPKSVSPRVPEQQNCGYGHSDSLWPRWLCRWHCSHKQCQVSGTALTSPHLYSFGTQNLCGSNKKRQNGVWPFPVVSVVLGVQSPCRVTPGARKVCCPRQCALHSWRRSAAELILLILAQCTCVGHNIVCPLRGDCDGCVFINCNINNTAQYIWCFLATVPRSANTWLVQSQIQAPCKPDTLLKVPTSLLWFVMLQIEHKTVDGQGFSVRFKWILKIFAHTGHYFTLLISLLTCKFKVRRNSPHLSSASGKLRTSVQLCPLWLFSEKNGHLQNSSHFSDYYPQREVCLTLFCWDVWLLDSLCWGRWMPSKLHIANRIVLNLSILMFGPKEEVGSPAQQHLQCHWKKVALAGVYVTFWRETFTKK